MDDPEEWWHVLEAANKYMNTRLVEQIERRLRDIARKEGGKGVILKHLKMAYRIGFDSSVKTVFLNSVIKNTSKLIQTDQWNQLEESSIMKIYDQDFLEATKGELTTLSGSSYRVARLIAPPWMKTGYQGNEGTIRQRKRIRRLAQKLFGVQF